MKVVVFAGGVGTRLWPLSRKKSPKQFEKIVGDKSTIQLTVERLFKKLSPSDIFISTGKQYRDIIEEQLPTLPDANIIVEPMMRDVGPAVGLITAIFAKIDPDEPMAILWGDHIMKEDDKFLHMLLTAGKLVEAEGEKFVFMGQKPRFANQNIGWIEYGEEKGVTDDMPFHELKAFQYRPPQEVADEWLKDGKHSWNLGYFVVKPRFLWKLFETHVPEMFVKLRYIQQAYGTSQYGQVLNDIYPNLEKINFDNIILEKLNPDQAYVMSEELGWSDLGAWEALKEALQKDELDTVTKGEVIADDTTNSLVYDYQGKKLVVAIGLDDMLIVNTDDVLLVARKSQVSKVKKLVENFVGSKYEPLT